MSERLSLERHNTLPELAELPGTFADSPDNSKWSFLKTAGLVGLLALSAPEAQAEEHDTTLEELQVAEAVLGAELVRTLEQQGFVISVPVAADESGSYIIHVGQQHTHAQGVGRMFTADSALEFQTKLRDVLPRIVQEADSPVVFSEGYTFDPAGQKKLVTEVWNFVENNKNSEIQSLEDANEWLRYLEWLAKYSRHRFVLNSIDSNTVADMQDILVRYLDEYQPIDDLEVEQLDILTGKSSLLFRGQLTKIGEGFSDFDSAEAYLYMHDLLEIYPAETNEGNSLAHKYLDEESAKRSEFNAAKRSATIKHPEMQAIMSEITPLYEMEQQGNLPDGAEQRLADLREEFLRVFEEKETAFGHSQIAQDYAMFETQAEHAKYTVREGIILDRISEYELEYGPISHPVVLFGNNHDLGDNLAAYNAENEPTQPDRGLIEIKSTEE